jgi:hypothetical protein
MKKSPKLIVRRALDRRSEHQPRDKSFTSNMAAVCIWNTGAHIKSRALRAGSHLESITLSIVLDRCQIPATRRTSSASRRLHWHAHSCQGRTLCSERSASGSDTGRYICRCLQWIKRRVVDVTNQRRQPLCVLHRRISTLAKFDRLGGTLDAWRQSVERRFAFNPATGVDRRDVEKVEQDILKERRRLEQAARTGHSELSQLRNMILNTRTQMKEPVEAAYRAHLQATVDYKAVGGR